MKVDYVEMPETLPEALELLHADGLRNEQTLRGGTQVNLATCKYKAVHKLIRTIAPKVKAYMGRECRLSGLWSSRMERGGYHIPHNHPKGSVSGVYYVSVGDGASLEVGGESLKPEKGMLVLFPSDTPHWTTVYEGETPRLTVAFDVV